MKINRGDIYIAELSSLGGCEQRGRRPVLVIQNDIGNKYSPVVIVAAIMLKRKPKMPTHVELFGEQGVLDHSIVLLEQIRTLDKRNLGRWVGTLRPKTMEKIDSCLEYSVGLAQKYPIEMTLCASCAAAFRKNSDTKVWRVNLGQEIKELCTYCGVKMGYDYFILDKEESLT